MVERRLDHVRMNLEVAHASGNGPAEVAQLPWLHLAAETAVERLLAFGPGGEAARRTAPEQVIARAEWKRRAHDLERRRWQVDKVGTAVLRPLFRKFPSRGVEAEFACAHATSLLRSFTDKDQQPNIAIEIVVAVAGIPGPDQFGVGKHPITRLGICRLAGADDRVGLRPTLLHRPLEERRDCTPRGRGCGDAVFANDGGEPGGDVGVGDLVEPTGMQRPEIGAGEVKLGDFVGGGTELALLVREIGVDRLAERELGRDPLRRLLALGVPSERDTGEHLAGALAGLCGCEPLSGAEGDTPGAAV